VIDNKPPVSHLQVTLLILAAAIASYVAGFALGARLLVLAGGIFETMFWIRILGKRYKRNRRLKSA
jgi:hypothetical protein